MSGIIPSGQPDAEFPLFSSQVRVVLILSSPNGWKVNWILLKDGDKLLTNSVIEQSVNHWTSPYPCSMYNMCVTHKHINMYLSVHKSSVSKYVFMCLKMSNKKEFLACEGMGVK